MMLLKNRQNVDEKLIFIHIPKAAGTSARYYFKKRFGNDRVGWLLDGLSKEDLAEAAPGGPLGRLRVIGGHFEFATARRLPGSKTYATLYREPVVRAISLYRFIQRRPAHRLYDKISDSLVESCRKLPGLRRGIENIHVRYFGRRKNEISLDAALETLSSNPFYLANSCNGVGLISAIEADFESLMPFDGKYKVANVNSKGSAEDPLLKDATTMDYLRELTSKDQELYDILHNKLGETGIVTPASPLSL